MRTMDNGYKLSDELLESISGGRKYAPSGYIQSLDESSEEPSLGASEVLSAWRYW